MKSVINKLSYVVLSSILLMSLAIVQSCSKSSSPSGPAVTSVTSGSTDTVGTSRTLTITGARLTGATVTTTATGVTITGVSVASDGNSLTATITVDLSATPGSISLKITTSAGSATTNVTIVGIPLIGGYTSSDAVASGNLIAYWPFDGNANDSKGGLTASTAGSITYTSGVRGQAYQGADGAYATYSLPSTNAFTSLASYTLSFWYKVPAGQATISRTQGLFFVEGTTTQNLLINEIEPYTFVSGDSVRIHTGFNDVGAPAYQLFVPETIDSQAINKWVFFTVEYNGGTSTYTVYQDAVPSPTSTAFSNGGYITPNPLYTDGSKATPLGALNLTSDAAKTVVIGTWPDGLFGQSAAVNTYLGQLDEVRVFNKALTQAEIAGLYLNGLAGR